MLCCAAVLAAVWLSLAVDQLGRALAGAALGLPFSGLAIVPERNYVLTALQGPTASLGAWEFTAMVLAGTVSVVVVALAVHALVGMVRAPGPLRAFSLAWLVVALLWVPVALASAAVPGGTGPVADLYARLGDPRAGRRAAAVLGLVALVLTAGGASGRAVAVGRSWMRADSLEFRRRLVRVTAGWPAALGVLALGLGAGWAVSPWLLLMPAAVVAALQFRTR